MKKYLTITLIAFSSLLLGGCTLLGNKQEPVSTVNTSLISTPIPSVVVVSPTPAIPEDEVMLSSDNELDSIDADLDKLENLENVGLE